MICCTFMWNGYASKGNNPAMEMFAPLFIRERWGERGGGGWQLLKERICSQREQESKFFLLRLAPIFKRLKCFGGKFPFWLEICYPLKNGDGIFKCSHSLKAILILDVVKQ